MALILLVLIVVAASALIWRLARQNKLYVPETLLLAVLFLFGISSIILSPYSEKILSDKENWNWGGFIALLGILYLVKSLRKIEPDELGVRLFFGRAIDQREMGLTIVPWLLFELVKLPRKEVPLEIPAEPEKVAKEDEDNPKEGQFVPIRIVQPGYKDALFFDQNEEPTVPFKELTPDRQEAVQEDPLARPLTTEVNVRLLLRIKDGIQFIRLVGRKPEEVLERTKDAIIATLQSTMGKTTARESLAHKDILSRKILKRVEELVGEPMMPKVHNPNWWGIDILAAEVMQIDPGKRVNENMADAAAAEFAKQKTVIDAQGEKTKRILEGEGEGAKRKSILQGEAAGLEAKAKVLATPEGALAGKLAVTQAAFEAGKHSTIVAGSDILGAVVGAAQAAVKETSALKNQ